jgi:alpha-galactosidase
MAWQFDRPEMGEGIVQAFRHDQSDYRSMELRLRGLEPDAEYRLTDFDSETPRTVTGKALMEQGVYIDIAQRPGAALVRYKKVK